jgi:hypothetical protein
MTPATFPIEHLTTDLAVWKAAFGQLCGQAHGRKRPAGGRSPTLDYYWFDAETINAICVPLAREKFFP